MDIKIQILADYGLFITLDAKSTRLLACSASLSLMRYEIVLRTIATAAFLADRLRKAVRSLEVPEDEFFQFTEETKAR